VSSVKQERPGALRLRIADCRLRIERSRAGTGTRGKTCETNPIGAGRTRVPDSKCAKQTQFGPAGRSSLDPPASGPRRRRLCKTNPISRPGRGLGTRIEGDLLYPRPCGFPGANSAKQSQFGEPLIYAKSVCGQRLAERTRDYAAAKTKPIHRLRLLRYARNDRRGQGPAACPSRPGTAGPARKTKPISPGGAGKFEARNPKQMQIANDTNGGEQR
jgi:hypothetical protein